MRKTLKEAVTEGMSIARENRPATWTIGIALLTLAFVTSFREAETGVASYYGDKFAGKPTASGEAYDPSDLTAAHRELPLGTEARVTYLETGESVVVEINDRGPFVPGRIIDLSRAAAREIGLLSDGVGEVEVEVL